MMKALSVVPVLLMSVLSLPALAAPPSGPLTLMPVPAHVQRQEGALVLRSTFLVETSANANDRLRDAIARAVTRIDSLADLRHAGTGVTPATPLHVEIEHPADAVQAVDEDESYKLDVSASGIRITAPNELGAMHALQTLIQLVQPAGDHYEISAVSIQDAPRFPWRGLLIDCGRHFEPIDVLKRNIDALAAVKMNVFHWHLTEDQGFRIESELYPELTAKGSDGLFYTQEQARNLVAYARARGVRVVPEFEMPGHSSAWLVAYPELASGTVPDGIRREFGVSNYAIDPTRDETYTFIARFLGEMATVFPDEYVHIGGDESPATDWKTNPRILAFMRAHNLKDNAALQAYFNTRVLEILKGLHKHMIGWDEVLTPGLPKDVVVQSWRGSESLAKGAQLGYPGILSAPYYLDHMDPAGKVYLADPVPSDSSLTPAERARVLGGEVTMWGEHVSARNIDSRIWPRTAAIAERLWSPAEVRDVPDMYRRLGPVSVQLEALGLTHLTSEDAGLRAMAHSTQIGPLRTFAQAFAPVSFGERYHVQRTDQLTPLDGFVDAVVPDPPSQYWLESTMKRFLADPRADVADRDALLAKFAEWKQSIPAVRLLMKTSPQLAAMSQRADDLEHVLSDAETAVHHLSQGTAVSPAWKQQAVARLESFTKPRPETLVHFVGAAPLRSLLEAASK
ncbi:hexosaminidase [Bryocella elongata]|uniref:Hexosaminidase n=1 Tax=Bryocella elongata TaxID=863522 RepID=A0A1H5XW71_9BACT|nr:family 20 glycosylhydrolase [Bryocella elongata]SEG15902.1 hexosaminidase [Bryocella elongata]